MTVKSSISLSDSQHAFARELVNAGKFPTVSAVVQHSLALLEERVEAEHADTLALKAVLEKRLKGPFMSLDEFDTAVDAMLADKRRARGLDG